MRQLEISKTDGWFPFLNIDFTMEGYRNAFEEDAWWWDGEVWEE